jgi:hypothetical protein
MVTGLLPQAVVFHVVWHGVTSAQNPGKPPRALTQSPLELPVPCMFGRCELKEPSRGRVTVI